MKNRALFLDRDGVINKEKNYLYKIEDFEFIDGVFETCKYFQDKGYLIIIITNQAGIARGYYKEDDFLKLTEWMKKGFNKKEIKITDVYFCPHHPEFTGECECRKPKPGMLIEAIKKYNIDVNSSILVGDKNSDIEVGKRVGIKKLFLVNTGHQINFNKFNVPILESLVCMKNL